MLGFIRDSVADALRATQPVTRVPGAGGSSTRGPVDRPASYSRDFSSERPAIVESPPAPQYEPPRIDRPPVAPPEDNEVEEPAYSQAQPSAGAEAPVEHAVSNGIVSSESWLDQQQLEKQPLPGLGHGIKPLGQIRDSYIVATDEEGLLLVDQHAAHERVLFEEIRDGRLARGPQVQQLLIPETLDLSPAEAQAFAVVREELENMGLETMELSGRTIAIKTAPAGLASADVIQLVREALAVVERERRDFNIENVRDQMAASLACKAAIKVNMPLTSEKMQWLIDELMKTDNPMTCPHGRPSIMRMQLRDIERGFKRPV
jgi:DNA mismatch repair protein MutL